jgi:hypothetical protein
VTNLLDVAEMPDFNPVSNQGTGATAQRDVSSGGVYLHPVWKVACRQHGAMNAVNVARTLWRCLMCNVGGYVPRPNDLPRCAPVERAT